ncbi:MAG: glycosyltransferase, partial [Psittacicella sp.]
MVEPITPFFINQSNVIVASCNDKYIPYLSVMLLSLQECTQDKKFYDIIILEYNVSFKNKEIIQNLIERKNIYLRFFNIEGVLPNEVLANITPYISKDMYSRILIPELCKQY